MSQTYYNFTITKDFIKEISFSNPDGIKSLLATAHPPQVEVSINIEAVPIKQPNLFESIFKLKFNAYKKVQLDETGVIEDAICFLGYINYSSIAELSYGEWSNERTQDEEQLKLHNEKVEYTLMVEIPKIAFPFVRQIVATITREAGFPPLLVNSIDFNEMYKTNKTNQIE